LNLKKYLVILLLLCCFYDTYATHNRAGEITYEQIGPLTVRARVTTYTKTTSAAADRDSLEVNWGDGTKQWVTRTNGRGVPLDNDVKLNYYISEHTYPGRGSFIISFEDPNRIAGILNINFPRSDEVKFFLSTRLTLLDQQFQGPNSSAILLQPPLDIGCVGKKFIHNPNAYDPDGDSLSFEFTVPLESDGMAVPNYIFPDKIMPGNGNKISLNPITGEFVWNAPPQPGEYNIAFLIKEWRNGVVINNIVRDMQILVSNCTSNPPTIEAIDEICVIAGTEVKIDVTISDKDVNQLVRTFYTGGPIEQSINKPIITNIEKQLKPSYISTFTWKTTCDHIKKEAYQIVIRASDNSITDSFGLSALKTIRIKVVGPPPVNLTTTTINNNSIRVRWSAPYQCENDGSKTFIGFSVWRSEVSSNLKIDTCFYNGITAPYRRIVFNTNVKDSQGYFIDDIDLQDNVTYCYRVVAEFNNIPSSTISINRVQSLPSEEACAVLKRDIPLFVKSSITNTSTNGNVEVRWVKPLTIDFDTLKFLPPYRTELLRRIGNTFEVIPASVKTFNSFANWQDTSYNDIVNTVAAKIDYKLNFYYETNKLYKAIPNTSTIFLTISPMDRQNVLSWSSSTPWNNEVYYIYRKIEGGLFQLIDSVRNATTYTNGNLSNDINYCYRIESKGSYNIKNITSPILNFSQEVCSKPKDINAPCPPEIKVESICDEELIFTKDLVNRIVITNTTSCGSNEVPSKYNVYYKSKKNESYKLLKSTTDRPFLHEIGNNSIAGCYQVTSLDALQNESMPSNEICIDNCPIYQLPNTFTPNGDGSNEIFKPIKNFFIKSVNFKLFNEWGNLIYETTDPAINWDGNYKNGDQAPTGTYYYTCSVSSESLENVVVNSERKGFINLLR
jgi:gliding motility-associated-like protein